MTPGAFIAKWRASELKESSAAQEHFIDLCRMLGEPTPAEADPTGETYCFERGARKDTGESENTFPTSTIKAGIMSSIFVPFRHPAIPR